MMTVRTMRTVEVLAISQHPVFIKRLTMPLIMAGKTLFSGSDLYEFALPRVMRQIWPQSSMLYVSLCAYR